MYNFVDYCCTNFGGTNQIAERTTQNVPFQYAQLLNFVHGCINSSFDHSLIEGVNVLCGQLGNLSKRQLQSEPLSVH